MQLTIIFIVLFRLLVILLIISFITWNVSVNSENADFTDF